MLFESCEVSCAARVRKPDCIAATAEMYAALQQTGLSVNGAKVV